MAFAEKFDLLMKLTGTTNSALAKYALLDPSYISRLRHGGRALPKDSGYAVRFASFFLRRCVSDYQKTALCQAVGIPGTAAFGDTAHLGEQVARWLCDEEEPNDPVGALLTDFSRVSAEHSPQKQASPAQQGDVLVFYGDDGRRQATITLFNRALQQPGPVTLLLFSDESAEWMNRSAAFSYEWSSLLWQIILRGGRVRVIHKVSRDIDEMFDVIRRWLPFYATGAVDPYYYPRLRDGIYKRTLSVVQGVAAAFCTSIGQQEGLASTFLTAERPAVDSFTNEFSSYLALCRPLIQVLTPGTPKFEEMFSLYMARRTPGILQSDGLPLAAMPKGLLAAVAARCGTLTDTCLGDIPQAWPRACEAQAASCGVCHILRLASPDTVLEGKVPISCAGLFCNASVTYTPQEYRAHLENILRLLRSCPRYEVLLCEERAAGFALHVFEDGEVFIFKEAQPALAFKITESNTASAFWDYMQRYCESRRAGMTRAQVTARVKACIAALPADDGL